MKIDKRKILREIRKKWDEPEKLLEFLLNFENQEGVEREIIRKKTMEETAKNYSIALAYTLNYKYGFGKKRLPEMLEQIMYTFDCFISGHLNLEDCEKELERVGIKID
mgnify:CR=1 FL=1